MRVSIVWWGLDISIRLRFSIRTGQVFGPRLPVLQYVNDFYSVRTYTLRVCHRSRKLHAEENLRLKQKIDDSIRFRRRK